MNIILIVIVLQYSNWIAVLSENNLNQFKKHNESGLYNLVHSGDGTLENLFSDADFPKNGDIPLLNRKIVKGTRVTINEHPYIVSIRRHFSHYLMGAIILKNVVISVAHPLYRVSPTELHTVCGENYSDRGTYLFTVLLVVIHEDYNPLTLEGDLALLRLYEDIIYRISIKAISLVSPILPLDGQTGFVTGWGRCDRTGKELCLPRSSIFFKREKYDSMLRTVTFTLNTSNPYCDPYYKDTKVNDGMICLGDARETDWICPCLAVPGAPLVVGARLVALQSWGFGCGYTKDLPLMYTNLQYYQPWLVHNIPILRTITHDNLTELFEATKAQMLTEWLHRTRHLVPFIKQPALHEINPLLVDTKLSLLWGTVYDVRDFIFFGTFHESKLNLYREMEQKSINLKRPDPMTLVRREKFLNNDTLKDSGLFIVNGTLHEIESDETTYDSYISTVTTASTRNITFYLESL